MFNVVSFERYVRDIVTIFVYNFHVASAKLFNKAFIL
jgi:hypothetical protein